MIHALKTIPEFYQGLELGEKTFEIRNSDRDFKIGDKLLLQEYNPDTKKYTGKEQERIISYILTNEQFKGIKQGYCILGFKIHNQDDEWVKKIEKNNIIKIEGEHILSQIESNLHK